MIKLLMTDSSLQEIEKLMQGENREKVQQIA